MQIKTYIEDDLASALARARTELGPDALVLGSRDIRDDHGRSRTEISVGLERPRSASDTRSALRRLAGTITHLRIGTERQTVAQPETPPRATPAPDRRRGPAPTAVEIAVASLVQSGLSEDLAARFAAIASRNLKTAEPGRMALAAERGVAALLPFGQIPIQARILFVVGPPGAGKTRTVAKLAARAVEASSRRVIYAMADSEKVGALGEARIYARHVGAELRVIDAPEDLRRTLLAAHGARVLIDTAGIGAADDRRLAALGTLRSEAPGAQVVLVMPAGLHRAEADRVLEQFASVRPTCVAFSKVDDGRRIGDLVTALARTDLPLAFTTHGHRVPDDLVAATPRRLAALMMRAGRSSDKPGPRPGSLQESTR